jgi:hypothetical protein
MSSTQGICPCLSTAVDVPTPHLQVWPHCLNDLPMDEHIRLEGAVMVDHCAALETFRGMLVLVTLRSVF